MNTKNRGAVPDLDADPFGERMETLTRTGLRILGGRFHFQSNSKELLHLVDEAYAGLPGHQFSKASREFRVTLRLAAEGQREVRGRGRGAQPPPLAMLHGAQLLGAATESSTFAALSPEQRSALVSVSRDMLKFPYHTRYELIEFVVFTLASRAQGLVPLHAACVGLNGRGILLMGTSGSGKSTVAMQCLLEEFDFLAEDSVFVSPAKMLATGTANFLHVRTDSLQWLGKSRAATLIRKSPKIRRRSGVEKFEVNLRNERFRLAARPLKIIGVAFLSPQSAHGKALLQPLPPAATISLLRAEQAYGASLRQWPNFERQLARVGGFELRRGKHPSESAAALRSLLLQK
jgi:hypothetical protein